MVTFLTGKRSLKTMDEGSGGEARSLEAQLADYDEQIAQAERQGEKNKVQDLRKASQRLRNIVNWDPTG
jgi:hypothetical protein